MTDGLASNPVPLLLRPREGPTAFEFRGRAGARQKNRTDLAEQSSLTTGQISGFAGPFKRAQKREGPARRRASPITSHGHRLPSLYRERILGPREIACK